MAVLLSLGLDSEETIPLEKEDLEHRLAEAADKSKTRINLTSIIHIAQIIIDRVEIFYPIDRTTYGCVDCEITTFLRDIGLSQMADAFMQEYCYSKNHERIPAAV
jgi:hypothetical protein